MMAHSPTSILVIGAGELGLAVLNHLAAHPLSRGPNTRISVLLRPSSITNTNPAKVNLLTYFRSLSITPVPGDIANDSVSTLATIFAPFTTVISCSGMTGTPGTQTKIARAALAASVPRYIPWQFGVDYDAIGYAGGQGMFSEQLYIRAMLRGQQGTDWKILSNGMFMSFVFEEVFGVVVKEGEGADAGRWRVNALGSWANRVTLTDVDDIGRATAEVVFTWSRIPESIVFLAGETVSYGQLADAIEKTIGQPVERVEWTVDFLKAKLAKDPKDQMKKYRVVFAEGKGLAWDRSSSFSARKGIATVVTLEQGVKMYLKP